MSQGPGPGPVLRPAHALPQIPAGARHGGSTDVEAYEHDAADPAVAEGATGATGAAETGTGLYIDVLSQGGIYDNVNAEWSATIDPSTADT